MSIFSKDKKNSETHKEGFWKSVYEGEFFGRISKKAAGIRRIDIREHFKNVIIPQLKERKTAIRAAAVFLVAAGVLLYTAAGHRAVDRQREITKILHNKNTDITRQLDATASELDNVSEEFNKRQLT